MPLLRGSSTSVIQENIRKMISEGIQKIVLWLRHIGRQVNLVNAIPRNL